MNKSKPKESVKPAEDSCAKGRPVAMTFDELLKALGRIESQEMRARKEDYFEFVVAVSRLAAVVDLLQAYFGDPFKPSGDQPSEQASAYAQPYGGVFAGQTLYFHASGQLSEVALLWPWGSGMAITVKVARG